MFQQLNRRQFVAGSALAAVMALAGVSLAAADEKAEKVEASVASNGDGTATVVDMAGREVVVPEDVQSVATFGSVGVLNAFVECLGKGSLIVNQMPANFTKNDKWAMQYRFAPQIADGPVLETADGVDLEATMVLAPDLCVTMTVETADQLVENGIPCIVLAWDDTEDVKVAVQLMGEVLGAQDVAEEYVAYFDEMVAKAAELTEGLGDDGRTAALYGDVESLTNPHIISEWWIEAAGGASVTKEAHVKGSLEYTLEELLAWDPDVIFSSNTDLDAIYADENIAELSAVEQGRVYVVPTVAHVWGNRTVEQPLTVMWALNKLYPELYSEEELAEDIAYFYATFFATELTDEEIDGIINYGA
jgi:iron complex transport system substrate-binding protein